MLTTAEITAMRAAVEASLPDTCRITRRAAGILNPTTGTYDVTTPTPLWSGRCRVRSRAAASRDVQVGDAHTVLGQYVATIPTAATGIEVDDFLEVTAATWAVELIGVPLQIIDIQLGSWDLGRRLILQTAKP